MSTLNLNPELMKKFINSIDDRIFRMKGTKINYYIQYDNPDIVYNITIDICSQKDNSLICRICLLDTKIDCINAIVIHLMNPLNGDIDRVINISSLYTIGIANRIFRKVQDHVIKWFETKEDG